MKNIIYFSFISLTICLTIFLNSESLSFAQNNPNSNPVDPGGQGVNAINIGDRLTGKNLGVQAPKAGGTIGIILKNVISLFFIVGGIGTLIYFVWGAVDWITSGGDKEKVSGARKKMTNAIIGLVLLALSYFIVGLVGSIVGFNPLESIQIRSIGEQ